MSPKNVSNQSNVRLGYNLGLLGFDYFRIVFIRNEMYSHQSLVGVVVMTLICRAYVPGSIPLSLQSFFKFF